MSLPADPFMLYSVINTLLRDKYSSLDELCAAECVSREDIKKSLSAAGFSYDERQNRFL